MPVSKNLTSHATSGLGSWTAANIETALKQGVAKDGTGICPPMPVGPMGAFGGLTAADTTDIANYIKSLPPIDNTIVDMCTFGPGAGGAGGGAGGAGGGAAGRPAAPAVASARRGAPGARSVVRAQAAAWRTPEPTAEREDADQVNGGALWVRAARGGCRGLWLRTGRAAAAWTLSAPQLRHARRDGAVRRSVDAGGDEGGGGVRADVPALVRRRQQAPVGAAAAGDPDGQQRHGPLGAADRDQALEGVLTARNPARDPPRRALRQGPEDYWMGAFVWNADRARRRWRRRRPDINGTSTTPRAGKTAAPATAATRAGPSGSRPPDVAAGKRRRHGRRADARGPRGARASPRRPPRESPTRSRRRRRRPPRSATCTPTAVTATTRTAPRGPTPRWCMRLETGEHDAATSAMYASLVDRKLQYWRGGTITLRVAAGAPEASAVVARMSTRGTEIRCRRSRPRRSTTTGSPPCGPRSRRSPYRPSGLLSRFVTSLWTWTWSWTWT